MRWRAVLRNTLLVLLALALGLGIAFELILSHIGEAPVDPAIVPGIG